MDFDERLRQDGCCGSNFVSGRLVDTSEEYRIFPAKKQQLWLRSLKSRKRTRLAHLCQLARAQEHARSVRLGQSSAAASQASSSASTARMMGPPPPAYAPPPPQHRYPAVVAATPVPVAARSHVGGGAGGGGTGKLIARASAPPPPQQQQYQPGTSAEEAVPYASVVYASALT